MELSLLFDQTFPPFKMSVGDATAMLLDAMEVPGGTQTPARRPAAPPFITFGWGKLKFKGACTSPDLHVQAVLARGRGAASRRQAQPHADRPAAQGPEPDHARAAGLRRAPRQGRRHVALDLLQRVRRRDEVAPDRRGQRRRQPAAPAPRQLAVAARASSCSAMPRSPPRRQVAVDRRPRRRRAARPRVPRAAARGQGRRQPDAARHGARPDHGQEGREHRRPARCRLGEKIEIKTGAQEATARRRRSSRARSRPWSPSSRPQGCRDLRPRLRQVAQAQPREARRARSSRCRRRTWSRRSPASPGLAAVRDQVHDVVHEFFQQSNETDWDFPGGWR